MRTVPPRYFSDDELAILNRNAEYRERGTQCPVCLNRGTYVYEGVERECPDDDYGHVALRMAKFYWLSNIPSEYQTLLWDEFPHQEAKQEIEAYLKHFEAIRFAGAGFSIYGQQLGVGKTWAAAHVLREIVKQGFNGWFVQFFALKSYFEIEDKEERRFLEGRVRDAEALVLDDVIEPWTDRQRDFFEEKLEEVVRFRAGANFPTIITTNLTPKKFEATYPRVFSLLAAKNSEFTFQGEDARRSGITFERAGQLRMRGEARPIT